MESKEYYRKMSALRHRIEQQGMEDWCSEKGYNLSLMNQLFYGNKDLSDEVIDKLYYDLSEE